MEGSDKSDLEFGYDASGNRISKKVIPTDGTIDFTTWYAHDAQGNILATYKTETLKSTGEVITTTLLEQAIYGSSRLGLKERNLDVTTLGATPEMQRSIGKKRYELTDHLGNVLSVLGDAKIPVDEGLNGTIDYYRPSLYSTAAYYPFGMQMPGGLDYNPGSYRFGFNGKEKDDEWKGSTGTVYDYGFRIYDARVCRFLSVDPLTASYPWYTPYQFAGNKPIWAIDLDGLEEAFVTDYYDKKYQKWYREYKLNPEADDEDKGKVQYTYSDKTISKIINANEYELKVIDLLVSNLTKKNNRIISIMDPLSGPTTLEKPILKPSKIIPSGQKPSTENILGDNHTKKIPNKVLSGGFSGEGNGLRTFGDYNEMVENWAKYLKDNPDISISIEIPGKHKGNIIFEESWDDKVNKTQTYGQRREARYNKLKKDIISKGGRKNQINQDIGDVKNKGEIKINPKKND